MEITQGKEVKSIFVLYLEAAELLALEDMAARNVRTPARMLQFNLECSEPSLWCDKFNPDEGNFADSIRYKY